MASRVIYPPILADYAPAFKASEGCTINFSLSRFNVNADQNSIHISVMKQKSGVSVVNLVNDPGTRTQRTNGKIIIINKEIRINDNLAITLENEDIKGGWQIGEIYKVQIRLSSVAYDGETEQNKWLNDNASNFSEQSTVCVIKPVGNFHARISSPFPDEELNDEENINTNVEGYLKYSYSTLELYGRIQNDDSSEKLKSYNLKLFKLEGDMEVLLEDSGEVFSNNYQDNNEFKYFFKKELKDSMIYKVVLTFTSINGYIGTFEERFEVDYLQAVAPPIEILTVDRRKSIEEHSHSQNAPWNSPSENKESELLESSAEEDDPYEGLTSIMLEEEEGRIGLKLVDRDSTARRSCNLCIRRSDEKSNFEDQQDLKIIILNDVTVSSLDVQYDYLIESGVYYKYAVQEIDRNGFRSLMQIMDEPVMREFQYSFLLGENNQQLKLKFDNTMQSFKIQQLESKMETIGSKYPIVTRNAAVEYKTFPIAGLISFQMDDNKLFCTRSDVYGEQVERHPSKGIYDYLQEKDFRNEVLKFLQDGKPKLFKSTTEGNIIVRLMDVNCTPNQSLGRMIYSFTSNGLEIAEANMDNYLKYNFYEVGDYQTEFVRTETKLGQLAMDLKTGTSGNDIIAEIYKKYSTQNKEIAGYINTITKIYALKITINDKPLKMKIKGNIVLGHALIVSGQSTTAKTIFIKNGIYDFDNMISFNQNDQIYFAKSESPASEEEVVNVNINFLYDVTIEKDLGRKEITSVVTRGIGQFVKACEPGEDILDQISSKYNMYTDTHFQELNSITSIEIEADPGSVFLIKDSHDQVQVDAEEHEINDTSVLRFYDLTDNFKMIKYKNRKVREQDSVHNKQNQVEKDIPTTVMITYYYTMRQGEYEQQKAQLET